MAGKKIVILSGATGFLGSHLLEAMVAHDYRVIAIKRTTSNTWRVEHLLKKVQWINADEQSLKDAFMDGPIDAVIHTACHYGRDGDLASAVVETNIFFALRLLEAAAKFKASVFLNTDSFFNAGSVIQGYMNYYALTKKHFVDWLHVFSKRIKIVNLRLQHIYGPKDDESKFVSWLFNTMLADISSIPLTKGEQQRDFIYIEDVVSAYLHLIELPNNDSFVQYDVGTGKLSTVRLFVETMRSEVETQLGVKIIPKLGFGEVPYREGELDAPVVDTKALIATGWFPKFDVSDGLAETIYADLLASSKDSRLGND